jgi:hypothetical protein
MIIAVDAAGSDCAPNEVMGRHRAAEVDVQIALVGKIFDSRHLTHYKNQLFLS